MQEAVRPELQFQGQYPGGDAAPGAATRRSGAAVLQPARPGSHPQRWAGPEPPTPSHAPGAGWVVLLPAGWRARQTGAVPSGTPPLRWPGPVCVRGQLESQDGTLQRDGQMGLRPCPHPVPQAPQPQCPGRGLRPLRTLCPSRSCAQASASVGFLPWGQGLPSPNSLRRAKALPRPVPGGSPSHPSRPPGLR